MNDDLRDLLFYILLALMLAALVIVAFLDVQDGQGAEPTPTPTAAGIGPLEIHRLYLPIIVEQGQDPGFWPWPWLGKPTPAPTMDPWRVEPTYLPPNPTPTAGGF